MPLKDYEQELKDAERSGYDKGTKTGYWNAINFLEHDSGGEISRDGVSDESLDRLMKLRHYIRIGKGNSFGSPTPQEPG